MALWLLTSDPQKRSFDDLAEAGWEGEEWEGLRDGQAFDYLTQMRPGDLALLYHGGEERRFVGLLRILGNAIPDKSDKEGRWLAVKVAVFLRLIRAVGLDEARADPAAAPLAHAIGRGARLAPVSLEAWRAMGRLGDMPRMPESGTG